MSALLWWCDFTYTICRVTLPTERVSWNRICGGPVCVCKSHAPHGACELKWIDISSNTFLWRVTLPTERVSWNFRFQWICLILNVTLPTERVSWNCQTVNLFLQWLFGHAPHGACELKYFLSLLYHQLDVTLPAERVSWNVKYNDIAAEVPVTLPTERVSWNDC